MTHSIRDDSPTIVHLNGKPNNFQVGGLRISNKPLLATKLYDFKNLPSQFLQPWHQVHASGDTQCMTN
ncbi:hypothetical protein, partial [Xanthomonas euvesicatoria]|uniref:hypothetical protein n=1 Tax=Xanthomonas euvesicatoria TaxID=456327 RepID=UPI001BAE9D59